MNTVLRVRIYAAGSDTYSHNIRKTPPMCWMQRERESGETSTVSVAVWSVWLLHAARATGTEFQTVDAAKEAACNWVSGSIQSTDNDWMNADSDGWRRRKTMWKNPRGSGDPFAVKKTAVHRHTGLVRRSFCDVKPISMQQTRQAAD